MALRRLCIEGVRCIAHAELTLHPQRNYIYGANGAGKTSLLEAVFLLGRGRSFRTRQLRQLVRRGEASLSVFGETGGEDDETGHRVGIGFDSSGLAIRVDGASGKGLLELSTLLGVQAIGPGLHDLVEGGPGERRRFLDWGVFHVEHDYLSVWRRYRRVLSQRNAFLKRGSVGGQENRSWTMALAQAGEAVHEARLSYVSSLAVAAEEIGRGLLGEPVVVRYRPGWREGLTLAEALADAADAEARFRVTQVGPHRGDLAVSTEAGAVRDTASRGQQKLVGATLLLAQARIGATGGGAPVLLVDDPAAELDREARERLDHQLALTGAQLFITGLSVEQLNHAAGFPLFHVEQGRVRQVV